MKKSESFYSASLDEFAKGRYDVAVFDATQAVILANDALCIAILGKRPSKDHREAVELHVQSSAGKENKKETVSDALAKRSEYAYTEKSVSKSDADMLLVRTQRFLDWVKARVDYE